MAELHDATPDMNPTESDSPNFAEERGRLPAEEVLRPEASKPTNRRNCGVCDTKDCKFACARCRIVYYCSAACQKTGWKSHKQACKKLETVDEISPSKADTTTTSVDESLLENFEGLKRCLNIDMETMVPMDTFPRMYAGYSELFGEAGCNRRFGGRIMTAPDRARVFLSIPDSFLVMLRYSSWIKIKMNTPSMNHALQVEMLRGMWRNNLELTGHEELAKIILRLLERNDENSVEMISHMSGFLDLQDRHDDIEGLAWQTVTQLGMFAKKLRICPDIFKKVFDKANIPTRGEFFKFMSNIAKNHAVAYMAEVTTRRYV